jgi:hypothetical protein
MKGLDGLIFEDVLEMGEGRGFDLVVGVLGILALNSE